MGQRLQKPNSFLYALCILKREKVPGLANKEIKIRTYPPVKVKEGLSDLSFLGAIVAQRGSGKMNALIRLIQHYDATAAFQKVIFFCPSWVTNCKYQILQESENYDQEVYIKFSKKIFEEVLGKIQADMQLWWAYEEQLEAWKRYLRVRKDEKKLTAKEQAILEKTDYKKPDAPNDLKKAPATLIVWDDMAGNKAVYNNTGKGTLHEFTILHRHWHSSLIHVVQHYHSAVGKQIRNNLSMLMLSSNKNKDIKKAIGTELSGIIAYKKFMEMWDESTKEHPYEFSMCDFDQKDPQKKFRKNFDEFFYLRVIYIWQRNQRSHLLRFKSGRKLCLPTRSTLERFYLNFLTYFHSSTLWTTAKVGTS
jgi:hypothetical protein